MCVLRKKPHFVSLLQSIGYTCPPRTNPPDFFMDVIAGEVEPEVLCSLFLDWNVHSLPIAAANEYSVLRFAGSRYPFVRASLSQPL